MHIRVAKFFSLFAVVALVLAAPALAQETNFDQLSQTEEAAPVITDVEALRLQLVQYTQNPENKDVKFDLVISPTFSSDRVQVTWQAIGVSEIISDTVQQISLLAGEDKTVSFVIRPRGLGATDVRARVEAFAADGTYSATASKTIGTFENAEVFPITNEYRIAQLLVLVKNVSLIAVVIIGSYLLIRFVYKKLRDRAFADTQS
ncbi:hypothetical protein KC640_00015 [Candidatus Dojkabacteria bacterium]|uniref:CopC domain-containing protein n=1 Tax=Candidatus Dojkabacteria bacterium TaxID=2099670 RepID=A0A955I4A8_9BACT|nr:hypothetical protein [Candidatus Dojkabacteria bacterium]